MFRQRSTPIVFAGPSLALVTKEARARLDLRPPARRGDIQRATVHAPTGVMVLIDGLFGSELAVTPAECREALKLGWTLVGASSMGALRASELWSVGMIGLGEVFAMYRLGVIRSDADVALSIDPHTFEARTASIVGIRAVLSWLEHRCLITPSSSRRWLMAARSIHWYERGWDQCLASWQTLGLQPTTHRQILELLASPVSDPKQRDAAFAIGCVLARRWIWQQPSPCDENLPL
jgi:hypothetical protein